MTRRHLTFLAFALSGAAGLVYESVWSRYLALLLGHSAYAQVLVIAVFLGGMGAGALLVGERSGKIRRPLLLYVVAELALAVLALAFHPAFRGAAELVERIVLPGLSGSVSAGLVQVCVAVVLIAPQTLLLGATFPLLAAGVSRRFRVRPGWTVAVLYFLNSLGGAAGVLLAGFAFVPWLGLPGALLGAAALNLVAGGLVAAARGGGIEDLPPVAATAGRTGAADPAVGRSPLWGLLLGVSFVTAAASFGYEVGWIRMLSLVMGSATHAFELMLSAFVLGLAIGGFAIRSHSDVGSDPLRLLAWIQWLMGAAALATLPLYVGSFSVMAWMVRSLPGLDGGYVAFNVLRYGIGLSVMLPATILAGMTLPLITGALVHSGAGERAFGWVYGVNTLGSVVGVTVAALVLLPVVGLKGLLVAGAVLDMAVGVVLFAVARRRTDGERDRSRTWRWRGLRREGVAFGLGALVVVGVVAGVDLDRAVLTGGVFRSGDVPEEGERPVLFYEDGRTATVGVHVSERRGLMVLTTNGKPDASLSLGRLAAMERGPEATPRIIEEPDEATQLFSPLVAMAHAPDARRVANIGHGSGISGHVLLGSPEVEELVTVEIEPAVIRAARAFDPANRRVYEDPRSSFAVEDARTYFSRSPHGFDLILSEPSNPWVSGTSSLFTVEFYRRARSSLAEDGVLAQWFQLYEMSDDLVLTVLAAIHRVFPAYRAYLVGPRDLLVVASKSEELSPPDWSVLEYPGVEADLQNLPRITGPDLEATRLFDRRTLAPLLDGWTAINSDFRPVLDYGAERARILGRGPTGIYRFATADVDLTAALTGEARLPAPHSPLSARHVAPMERRATGSGLRAVLRGAATLEAPLPGAFEGDRGRLASFMATLESDDPPASWSRWSRELQWVVGRVHGVTSGWADPELFGPVERYLDRVGPVPEAVRVLVRLRRSAAAGDLGGVADATASILKGAVPELDPLGAAVLVDAGVVASLRVGRPADARRILERFSGAAGYASDDARRRLLEAWIRRSGSGEEEAR